MMKSRKRPLLPQSTLNNLLLRFPFLYGINFIKYESGLRTNGGISDLLSGLNKVLNVEGDIIECGSYRCGSSVIMAKHLKTEGVRKKIYALDLFGGGFEISELEEERRLGLTQATNEAFTYNSYHYVKSKIQRLGFSDIIIPVKGLFEHTLPKIDSKICLSLIDCDLKKSIIYSAEAIWPKLSREGIILFDDYLSQEYKGAKVAVDDFVNEHQTELSEHGLLNRLYSVRKNS
jgi:O-methyltransferase